MGAPTTGFTIEVATEPCAACGRGGLWGIVHPDGYMLGTVYEQPDDAEALKDLLNMAFRLGRLRETEPEEPEFTADPPPRGFNWRR